jgi:hypothetical protein
MSYAIAFMCTPYITAHCPSPCGHCAEIPLDALIARVGPDLQTDELCRRLRCAKCGRKGVTITLPSKAAHDQPWRPLRADAVPDWAKINTVYPIDDAPDLAGDVRA